MNGGSHNIAILADHVAADRDDELAAPAPDIIADVDAPPAPTHREPGLAEAKAPSVSLARVVASLAALGWAAGFAYAMLPLWERTTPPPEAMLTQVVVFCVPILLIVTLYALATRNGRIQSRDALSAVAKLRAEQQRLDAALVHLTHRIGAETTALVETHDSLLALGEDATHRMKAASDAMQDEIATLTRYGNALKFSATSARADVAVLLSDLPKAQLETRHMVSALQEAGATAQDRAEALDALLSTLRERGRDADAVATGAAEKLSTHLAQIEAVGDTASARLEHAASQMSTTFDSALTKAADAGEAARESMDLQAAAMRALVDQSQAALQKTGADSAEAIARHVDEVTHRVGALGTLLDGQTRTTAALLTSVLSGIEGVDTKFSLLDESATERADRLGAALGRLDQHAVALTDSLGTGTSSADTLIERTERLMIALDATAREVDETLPAALARLEQHSTRAHATLASTAPVVTQMGHDASAALDRLIEAEAIVAKQRTALDDMAKVATDGLAKSQKAASDLVATVEGADATARALADGAGAQLVDAMVRVREAAQVAADRAREAISEAIPHSTATLTNAVREALTKAITEEVTAHLTDLSVTAEHAVEAAARASEKLMRQMLAISETSAAVEARIVDAQREIEAGDQDNFARRVALLIESLNSTAIDVAKILASDITDVSWAAYLRGDRGIFTRRAVRLLDAGEAREILRQYENDPAFSEQVNRYIHDFEAILRNVLATRDGSSLGVTLLSSDMGKLYVALAQAIERLRS